MITQESDEGLYEWPIYEEFGLSVRDTVDFVHETADRYRERAMRSWAMARRPKATRS